MKYINANGEFQYMNGNPGRHGDTLEAAHEPVQEWNLTEHVLCPVCGEKTMYERGHFPPSKVLCKHLQDRPTPAQIKLLCDIRALPFEPIENGRQLLKLIMDYDKAQATDAEAQLETARKALDRIRLHNDSYVSHSIAVEALAQIDAGQKGGK